MSEQSQVSILMDNAQAADQLERMAKAWERAAEAQERAAKSARDMDVERERIGNRPATLHDRLAQGVSGLGGIVSGGVAGTGMAIMGHTMSGLANALNKLNDSTVSAAQRTQAFAEALPVIGSFVRGIREMGDAMSGVADRLNRQALAAERHAIEIPGRYSTESYAGELDVTSAGRRGLAGYWAGAARRGFGGLGVADPKNLLDPYQAGAFSRQIGIAQSRQGIQAQIAELEARQRGLTKEGKRLDFEAGMGSLDLEEAEAKVKRLQETKGGGTFLGINMSSNRNKAEIDRAARDAQIAATALAQLKESQKKNELEQQQTALQLDQKRTEEAKVNIAVEREKLTVLKEQEGLVRQQTQSWGRMTPAQRSVLGAWAKQAANNPNSLAIGQLDMLAQVAPQAVQRIYEQRGLNDPGLQELQRNLGALNNTPMGLDANMREQRAIEKRLVELGQQTEANAASAMSKSFDSFIGKLITEFEGVINARLAALRAGQIQRANAGSN